MENKKLKHYEYLKFLDRYTELSDSDKEIVNLFNTYLSNNKNFKYNSTYLQDSIIPFSTAIESFHYKKRKIMEFKDMLSSDYYSLAGWFIIFDNVYVITDKIEVILLVELLNSSDTCSILSNCLDKFKFFASDEKIIQVKYIKFDTVDERQIITQEHVIEQKCNETIQLLSFVLNDWKRKTDNAIGDNDVIF